MLHTPLPSFGAGGGARAQRIRCRCSRVMLLKGSGAAKCVFLGHSLCMTPHAPQGGGAVPQVARAMPTPPPVPVLGHCLRRTQVRPARVCT